MNGDHVLVKLLWPALAAIAGAVTALSFRAWQGMTRGEIAFALFVGCSFAIFVGPYVTFLMFGQGPIDLRIQGAVLYIAATGSNTLLPLLVRKFQTLIGKDDA